MKKFQFVLILMITCVNLRAQHLRLGLLGGITLNKQQDIYHSSQYGDKDFSNGSRVFYQLGVNTELKLSKSDFYFQPAIKYIVKGTSRDQLVVTGSMTNDYVITDLYRKISYLGLYPAILYKQRLAKTIGIGFSATPYFAYALGGEEQIPYVEQSNSSYVALYYSSPKKIGFDEDGFKRSDYGIGAAISMRVKEKIIMEISYEHGFTDIVDGPEITIKNRTFGLTVGYILK